MSTPQVILHVFLVFVVVTSVDACHRGASSMQPGQGTVRAPTGTHPSAEVQEYPDSEVAAWTSKAPKIVPLGQSASQATVLASLGIDRNRLRDHRVVGSFNSIIETWQVSESYDIEWMSEARDAHEIGSDGRQIYGLRILPRAKQYP
jgi:hypothetical protein